MISFASLEGSLFSTIIPTFSAPTYIGVAVTYRVLYYVSKSTPSFHNTSTIEITGSLVTLSILLTDMIRIQTFRKP